MFVVTSMFFITGASFWGPMAALGAFFGITGTTFNLLGIWLMIRLIASAAMANEKSDDEKESMTGAAIAVFIFLIKLPVMVGLMMLVQRIGGFADDAFLAGLGLVYCWLIGWAESSKD